MAGGRRTQFLCQGHERITKSEPPEMALGSSHGIQAGSRGQRAEAVNHPMQSTRTFHILALALSHGWCSQTFQYGLRKVWPELKA
mmetsp:Transcript_48288/g.140829  ORF Transcript_48288/g.140829 Transcript_48288/m.140829 type:complete len:85 (+) Transcript_48288:38-292(+)